MAKDGVQISETRERIAHAPPYDPKLVELPSRSSQRPLYG